MEASPQHDGSFQTVRLEKLLPLLRAHGRSPVSFLGACNGNAISLASRDSGFVSYRSCKRANVILGEPVSTPEDSVEVLGQFVTESRRDGKKVVAVGVTTEGRALYDRAGFHGFECGSDPVVDLKRFDLDIPARRNLRRGARRAARAGVTVEEIAPRELAGNGYRREFKAISADWIAGRKTGLFTFIVGEPFMQGWSECRHFVARTSGRLEAFAIFYPIYPTNAVYMDITRRHLNSPPGTMDLLLTEALRMLTQDGVESAYLGVIPCALSAQAPNDLLGLLMRLSFDHFSGLYPMRSEHFFKQKFAPEWRPSYACFHEKVSISGLMSILTALWPGGISEILRHKFPRRIDSHVRRRLGNPARPEFYE